MLGGSGGSVLVTVVCGLAPPPPQAESTAPKRRAAAKGDAPVTRARGVRDNLISRFVPHRRRRPATAARGQAVDGQAAPVWPASAPRREGPGLDLDEGAEREPQIGR